MGRIISACKKKRLDAYSTDIILKTFDLLVESEVKASDLENAEDELYQKIATTSFKSLYIFLVSIADNPLEHQLIVRADREESKQNSAQNNFSNFEKAIKDGDFLMKEIKFEKDSQHMININNFYFLGDITEFIPDNIDDLIVAEAKVNSSFGQDYFVYFICKNDEIKDTNCKKVGDIRK